MNTKKKSGKFLLPVLILSALLFQRCNNADNEDHSQHTSQNSSQQKSIEQLIVSPNKQVLSRQATIKLAVQHEAQTIKAQGYIDFDESRFQSVSARFGGRIENLYVKYDMQFVKKGEKIMDLYSPELNTWQEEHLFLLKTIPIAIGTETSLLEKSREKLRLLGITENQIVQLEENGTSAQTISVFSPAAGYVFFNSNSETASSDTKTSTQGMNMNAVPEEEKQFSSSNSQIREGVYVNTGQTLFSINDLNTVWAIISIPNEYSNSLKVNQSISIDSELFSEKLNGIIMLTEPAFVETKQRFIRIRVSVENKNKLLKLNSLLNAEIPLLNNQSFQIPSSSVYHTGLNSYVWVKKSETENGTGIFELRKVIVGSATNGIVSIVSGLSPDEEIAKEAGFMTDSETFLNAR